MVIGLIVSYITRELHNVITISTSICNHTIIVSLKNNLWYVFHPPPDKPSDDLHLTPAMFVQLKDAVTSPFAAEHEDDKTVSLVRY